MSETSVKNIKCPRCGKVHSCTVYPRINTGKNPEMIEKVRSGEVFRFTCKACGHQAMLDFSFLYHETQRHIMIYYLNNPKERKKVEAALQEGKDSMAFSLLLGSAMEGYVKRLVFSMNQFKEKLTIFDEGLDDRVIELIKAMLYGSMKKQNPAAEADEIYFLNDQENEQYLVQFLKDGEVFVTAQVAKELYTKVEAQYRARIDQETQEAVVIDKDWAVAFISSGR